MGKLKELIVGLNDKYNILSFNNKDNFCKIAMDLRREDVVIASNIFGKKDKESLSRYLNEDDNFSFKIDDVKILLDKGIRIVSFKLKNKSFSNGEKNPFEEIKIDSEGVSLISSPSYSYFAKIDMKLTLPKNIYELEKEGKILIEAKKTLPKSVEPEKDLDPFKNTNSNYFQNYSDSSKNKFYERFRKIETNKDEIKSELDRLKEKEVSDVDPLTESSKKPSFKIDVKNANDKKQVIGKQNVDFGGEKNKILIGKTPSGESRFKIELDPENDQNYLIFNNEDGTLDKLAEYASDGEKLENNIYKYPVKRVTVEQSGNISFSLDNAGTKRKLQKLVINANEVIYGSENKQVIKNYGKDLFDITLPKNYPDLFLSGKNSSKYKGLNAKTQPRQVFETMFKNQEYFGLSEENFFTIKDVTDKEVMRVMKIDTGEINKETGENVYKYWTSLGTEMVSVKNPTWMEEGDSECLIGLALQQGTRSGGVDGVRTDTIPVKYLKEAQLFFGKTNDEWTGLKDESMNKSFSTSKPGEASVDGKRKTKFAKIEEEVVQDPDEQDPDEQDDNPSTRGPERKPTPSPLKPSAKNKGKKRWLKWLKYIGFALAAVSLAGMGVYLLAGTAAAGLVPTVSMIGMGFGSATALATSIKQDIDQKNAEKNKIKEDIIEKEGQKSLEIEKQKSAEEQKIINKEKREVREKIEKKQSELENSNKKVEDNSKAFELDSNPEDINISDSKDPLISNTDVPNKFDIIEDLIKSNPYVKKEKNNDEGQGM